MAGRVRNISIYTIIENVFFLQRVFGNSVYEIQWGFAIEVYDLAQTKQNDNFQCLVDSVFQPYLCWNGNIPEERYQ